MGWEGSGCRMCVYVATGGAMGTQRNLIGLAKEMESNPGSGAQSPFKPL